MSTNTTMRNCPMVVSRLELCDEWPTVALRHAPPDGAVPGLRTTPNPLSDTTPERSSFARTCRPASGQHNVAAASSRGVRSSAQPRGFPGHGETVQPRLPCRVSTASGRSPIQRALHAGSCERGRDRLPDSLRQTPDRIRALRLAAKSINTHASGRMGTIWSFPFLLAGVFPVTNDDGAWLAGRCPRLEAPSPR